MTPERWARIKEVLAIALEQPEKQRNAFLNEACGSDPELRQQIDTLLVAEPDSSLKSPAAEVLAGQATDTHIARGLAAGQMLGHYRIDSKLGEGGMGVVYKARDTHLDRFVAIKILPPEKVADPDRKRRFIQEAKAASALNHPNIVTIHDIAHENGIDFMVMEHVPGKTLSQVIPRKGLRLDQALRYAVEMAGALAAAHAAGIVHRDIKPANIMVTDKGRVKVLDFGLAKLRERTGSDKAEGSRSATSLTEEGTILGTVAYMSPEQAQGKPVDGRSDIFSFGSVLYEMLTGRRAFRGDNPTSTLASTIKEEPQPVRELVTHLPSELERLIARCLRKDPERRFQHMDDVRSLLEELKEESESGQLAATPPLTRRPRRKLIWAAAVLGIIGIAGAMFWLLRPASPAAQLKAAPLTTYPGYECCPSFSPDGNQVAFVWNGEKQDNFDIYLQVIGGEGRPLRLTSDPALETSPVWSPDGRYIAFVRHLPGKMLVMRMPVLGGIERTLVEVNYGDSLVPRELRFWGSSLAWTPDGKWLAYSDIISREEGYGLFLTSEAGEKRRLTTPLPKSDGDFWPAFSPDGRLLAFVRSTSPYISDLSLLALSGDFVSRGEPKRLTFENQLTGPSAWTADARELIYSAAQSFGSLGFSLWRIAAQGNRPAKPERLAVAGEGAGSPAISGVRRRLVYSQNFVDQNIWRVDVTGTAQTPVSRPIISSTRNERSPQYSPDGKRIAFVSDRSGANEVWVCDQDGSNSMPLTSLRAVITGSPRWSPDGQRIAFDSNLEGQFEVYVISAMGGRPRRLTNDPATDGVASWSRDGGSIYFVSNRSGQSQVWRMPAGGAKAIQVTKNGGYVAFESYDGKFVYYSKGGGTVPSSSLCKVPVEGGEETKVLEAVTFQNFSIVEKGIYFIPPRDVRGRRSIQFFDFTTGRTSSVAMIERPVANGLTVSPDGRSILYSQYDQGGSDLMLVENFR